MCMAGVLSILNELQPQQQKAGPASGGTTDAEINDAKVALDASALKLLKEEMEYDSKCLEIYFQKLSNYQLRVTAQRAEWRKRRLDKAKTATDTWWDSKAGRTTLYHAVGLESHVCSGDYLCLA